MHARARKRQKRAQLFISVRMHVLGAYVRVRARIIVKMNVLINRYTDTLSLKCYYTNNKVSTKHAMDHHDNKYAG